MRSGWFFDLGRTDLRRLYQEVVCGARSASLGETSRWPALLALVALRMENSQIRFRLSCTAPPPRAKRMSALTFQEARASWKVTPVRAPPAFGAPACGCPDPRGSAQAGAFGPLAAQGPAGPGLPPAATAAAPCSLVRVRDLSRQLTRVPIPVYNQGTSRGRQTHAEKALTMLAALYQMHGRFAALFPWPSGWAPVAGSASPPGQRKETTSPSRHGQPMKPGWDLACTKASCGDATASSQKGLA